MTADIAVAAITEPEARKLTEKIRITAHNYADARQKLQQYVAEAKAGNAHLVLGYASWTAYLSEVLGEEPMRLARSERQEMVQLLSAEGMSTRAIAPIVGASHETVSADMRGVRFLTPPTLSDEPGPIVKLTGPNSAATVTGLDGKSYARPEPAAHPAPKRRPITDQAADAGWDLARAVEKIERIITDDRLPANREVVTSHIKQHLVNSIDKLTTLLNTL